jgi:hypothetical protein
MGHDPSIINSDEERKTALAGDPAQQAAAEGLEAGLRAKAEQNTEGVPSTSEATGTAGAVVTAPEASQQPAEPAQPPQASVAVAEAPPAAKPTSGKALGLDTPPQTITSAGVAQVPAKEEQLSPTVRRFACAKQPNGRFLVRAGTPQQVVDPNSPGGLKMFARAGDKFIKFIEGVSEETRDLEVIAFCEAHERIIDVNDPKAGLQFDLERIQMPTAEREAVVIPGIDIGQVLSGKSPEAGLSGDSPIAAARRKLAEANKQI